MNESSRGDEQKLPRQLFPCDFQSFINSNAYRQFEEAGGVQFNDGELWLVWVNCSSFADGNNRNYGTARSPLSAVEAVKVKALGAAAVKLSEVASSLAPGLVSRIELLSQFSPVNALLGPRRPQPSRRLIVIDEINEIAIAAERLLKAAPRRKKGERKSEAAVSLIAAIANVHWQAKLRLTPASKKRANFDSLLAAVIETLPANAKKELHSAGSARKLLTRKRKQPKPEPDK